MNIITLDFETFFSDEFTLSKMTTEAYVRDPRFETHGCAVRLPARRIVNADDVWEEVGSSTFWIDQADIAAGALDDVAKEGDAFLCHHSQFDGLILNHHYNLRPKIWLDTLSMARQQLGNHLSASLDNVRQHFGMPFKRTPYDKFKGRHWHEMSPEVQREVADGACDEVESIWRIFNLLARDFPAECYPWVDNTVRMFTEPRLTGDVDMLGKLWLDETQHKTRLLEQLGVTKEQLGSDDVFADLLRKAGVEPETKMTAKENTKYAFAKTDPFMQEGIDDEDDNVRALIEARLSVKSTLQQTRSERLGYMATRGNLCVYISAFAAHTNRDGGGDKLNFQNFTRGSPLRKSIRVPKGHLIAKVDKSQIECRILNVFAGQWDVVERFRNKEDPYVGIASEFYGEQVYKPTKNDPRREEMEAKRGTGKTLELSCGFQSGVDTLIKTARKGTYGPPIYLTHEQGEHGIELYRSTHPAVKKLWGDAGRLISAVGGTNNNIQWQCVEVRTGSILLPNGATLKYPDLHYDDERREWVYKTRKGHEKIYGGKLTANVVSALAWVMFQQDICRIGKESGLWPSIREHDAGSWVIPDDQYAEQTLAYLVAEMSRPPSWMPDVPLDAEGSLT